MKYITLLLLMVSISTMSFAGDWLQEKRMIEDQNMARELNRELRDTGEIAPKDYIDVYNLKQGYGYDGMRHGGYDYQSAPNPYAPQPYAPSPYSPY